MQWEIEAAALRDEAETLRHQANELETRARNLNPRVQALNLERKALDMDMAKPGNVDSARLRAEAAKLWEHARYDLVEAIAAEDRDYERRILRLEALEKISKDRERELIEGALHIVHSKLDRDAYGGAEILENFGDKALEAGETAKALDLFQRSLKITSGRKYDERHKLTLKIAQCYFALGQTQAAVAALNRHLENCRLFCGQSAFDKMKHHLSELSA